MIIIIINKKTEIFSDRVSTSGYYVRMHDYTPSPELDALRYLSFPPPIENQLIAVRLFSLFI